VEGGSQSRERFLEIPEFRKIPVEVEAQQRQLEAHPVRRLPVDQLFLVRVPEHELLVLQGGAADVDEDLAADVPERADRKRQDVDQGKTELQVRIADGVADLLAEIEAAQGVEPAEVVDVREISGRVRAEEPKSDERPRR